MPAALIHQRPPAKRAGDNPLARRINRRAGAFKDKREMKLPWMNPRLRELLALAAVAAFGCGLAWSQGDLLFVAIFGAACALTIIEAVRRLREYLER